MPDLSLDAVTVTMDGQQILDNVTLTMGAGRLTAIIGPNGAGKSTLLRAIVALIRPTSGTIRVGDAALAAMPARQRAQLLAYLPQRTPLDWPVWVRDAVALGRHPHGAAPRRLSPSDQQVVEQVLDRCAISHLADRSIISLSGGELGRVHLARTLATQAPIMVVDEPVAALDPAQQLSIMSVLRGHADAGGSVVAVMHDLALVGRFADHVVALKDGRVAINSAVDEAMTPDRLSVLFDVPIRVDRTAGWPEARPRW